MFVINTIVFVFAIAVTCALFIAPVVAHIITIANAM